MKEISMNEKKPSVRKQTLSVAGAYRGLTYLSFVLSAATEERIQVLYEENVL